MIAKTEPEYYDGLKVYAIENGGDRATFVAGDKEDYRFFIDRDPESDPRAWYSGDPQTPFRFVFSHRRYDLPNEIDFEFGNFSSWEGVEKELKKQGYVFWRVLMYDHSGIDFKIAGDMRYWQHAEWDSGQVGYIVAKKDALRAFYETKRLTEKVMHYAEQEARDQLLRYSLYVQGGLFYVKIFYAGASPDEYEDDMDMDELDEEFDLLTYTDAFNYAIYAINAIEENSNTGA